MPDVRTDKQILDLLVDPNVKGTPEYYQGVKDLGVDDKDLEMYEISNSLLKENPDDEAAIKARNKVYDKVASNRPAINTQGVGFLDRFMVKNLISDEPKLQSDYFKKKGYQTRIVGNEVEVKKPDDISFKKIDPDNLDWFDATDLLGDVLEGAFVGSAGLAGSALGGSPLSPTGLAGAFMAGGAAAGGTETLRQSLAKYFGLRDELNPVKVAEAGILEGTANIVLPGATKYIKKQLEKGFDIAKGGAAVLKDTAEEIADTIKKAGLTPIKAQLTSSKRYRDLVADQIKSPPSFYSNAFKRKINKDFDKIRDEAKAIIAPETTKDIGEYGVELADAMSDDLATFIAPAKVLYESAEDKLLNAAKVHGGSGNNVVDIVANQSNLDYGIKKEKFLDVLFRDSLRNTLDQMEDKVLTKEGISYIKDLDFMIDRIDSFKKLDDAMSVLSKKYGDRNFTDSELRKLNFDFREKIRDRLSQSYKTISNIVDTKNTLDAVDNISGVFNDYRVKFEKLSDFFLKDYMKFKESKDFMSDLATDVFQNKRNIQRNLESGNLEKIKLKDIPSFSVIEGKIDSLKNYLETSLKRKDESGVIQLRKPLPPEAQKIVTNFVKDLEKQVNIYKQKDLAKVDILQAQQNILEADKLYKAGADVLKALTTKSGRKDFKKSLNKQFQDFIDGTPDQELVKKVLSFADINKAKKIRQRAPKTFEVLRKAEIDRIWDKINDDNDQRFINKLSTELKNMPKEKALLLFGEDYADKLMGFRKYIETFPVTTNPSGTAHTLWDMVTKANWLDGVRSNLFGIASTLPSSAVSRSRAREIDLLEKAANKDFTPKALEFFKKLDRAVSSVPGRGIQSVGARESILPLLPYSKDENNRQQSIIPGR